MPVHHTASAISKIGRNFTKKSLNTLVKKTNPSNKQTSVEETLHPQYPFHGLISDLPALPFYHGDELFWFFFPTIAMCFNSSGQESFWFFISRLLSLGKASQDKAEAALSPC